MGNETTPTVLVTDPEYAEQAKIELSESAARVVPARTLLDALTTLRGDGIESILIEGGAGLVTSLWTQRLIDRIYWIQAPIWLGDGVRAFRPPRTPLADADPWPVTDRRSFGEDTLLVMDRELCLQGL